MDVEFESLDSTVAIFEGPSDPLDDFDLPMVAWPRDDAPRPRSPGSHAIPPEAAS
jgi:hypothetical protein